MLFCVYGSQCTVMAELHYWKFSWRSVSFVGVAKMQMLGNLYLTRVYQRGILVRFGLRKRRHTTLGNEQ